MQARGEGHSFEIDVKVAWHDELQRSLVSIRMGDMAVAVAPEVAVNLGHQIIDTAHRAVGENAVRDYLDAMGVPEEKFQEVLDRLRRQGRRNPGGNNHTNSGGV